ncbi:protein MULTIPLE CHLOROPLAST DIVISION SITE 1 [Prosopis cineraria]|uniref:protein MULTIPLE CHLOROPLAST DIVISION SITE 1 n=1 Tax=Prosopis cineraria TaxID=364024 RepID=UPI00240F3249|nr:protein MULTIPLE CHLOROPLAST DIVISION SITE 1 [Prosopis cineraria]
MGSATIWGLRFEWISVEAKSYTHNFVFSSSFGRRIPQFRRRNGTSLLCDTSRRHLWLKPKALDATAISRTEPREQHYYVTDCCFAKIHHLVRSPPPFLTNSTPSKFWILLCVAVVVLVTAVRAFVVRKSRYKRPGSVADLVRRGQLRYDSRGISRPLKYEDPFNNPLVKVSKSKSTVEICGKLYRLAPVTLTEEQQAIHQRRRSRAYRWKRPTMFLKEGDSLPPDADPDSIRWIPANHPFATTAADIDENLAQNNVYQKHGVPLRIKAEHEALHRKLEALENEQTLNRLMIDPADGQDFERTLKSHAKSNAQAEKTSINNQVSDPDKVESSSAFEEKPGL